MVIDSAIAAQIMEHARSESPNEACGMLALRDDSVVKLFPMENIAASPVFFEPNARQLIAATTEIDDTGWAYGIYHSHTHTAARPSETDILYASNFERFYPGTTHVIVSLADPESPSIRAYRIDSDSVLELPVDIR